MIATASPNDPKGPYNVVMDVDPPLAFSWLEGNTHNRPVNQRHVDRLARDMKAGRWQLTHQGLAFDTTGLLADGQHRLCAVIEADVTVKTRVFFNEPPENRHVLDIGERRSNLDVLTITGQVGEVSAILLATLKSVLAGLSCRTMRLTPGEEAEHYSQHRRAVEFAVKHLGSAPTRGLAASHIRAVVARAYYSTEHARLAHFCDVLRSGIPVHETDHIIVTLRDFLIQTQRDGKGKAVQRLRYAKTQWALAAFLDGKLPKRLYRSDYEIFLLPEEAEEVNIARNPSA